MGGAARKPRYTKVRKRDTWKAHTANILAKTGRPELQFSIKTAHGFTYTVCKPCIEVKDKE